MKKYIDIFAGCGGLSLGLYNAGWKGLFAVKNEDAFSTLKYNLIDKLGHFELVKNSYDAGAKKVIIEFENMYGE